MNKIKLLLLLCFGISTLVVAQPVNGTTTFFTNTTTAINPNTACVTTKTCILSGWLFSISSTSNCGQNWTNSTGGDGRFQNLVGFGTLTQITFGSDDGSEFAMNNLIWGVSTSSWTSKSMKFIGYKDGMPVPNGTLNATTPSGTGILNTLVINFTSISGFNDVDEIRLAPNTSTCNSILFFEDITVGTATPSCISPTLSLTGSSNVLCNGGSTGSATMSASGGAPFTYTWSPSGGNAPGAIGLSAGIYTCVTTNSCGATASRTVTITQPPAVVGSTAVTNALCNGANGSATISASGGTAPYTYTWSSGPTSSVAPTLLAGTYTVKVTDINNCSTTRSVTITQPTTLNTATAVTNVLCFGNSTGAATVTATGGTSPYSYLWSGAQTTSVISGQTFGIKTVTITDANSCIRVATVNITQPPSVISTATAVTNVLCFGNSTGAASVTANGGTSPYSYLWSGAQTTSVISGQTAGVRTVTVTDANSCTATNTITITQPPALTLTAVASNSTICIGNSSTLTANGSGGNGTITYTWVSGPTNSINVVSPTTNTTYTVNATDANGCVLSRTITINTLTTPTVAVNSGAICFGQSFTIVPSGASSYTISGGSAIVSPTTTATYSITGSSGACLSTNTVISTVTVNALPTIAAASQTICSGSTTTLIAGGANTYTWSTGANTNSIAVAPATTTVYTVNGTSTGGCIGSAISSTVTIGAAPSIAVNSSTICSGNSATLIASGVNTYTWSNGSNTSSIIVTPNTNTVYTVNGNLLGCVSTATNTAFVTVNTTPTVTVNSGSVCSGNSFTITPSGASTYTISGGSSIVTPTGNTSFNVIGTSAQGCVSSGATTSSVTVNPIPTITVNSGAICAGIGFTIIPSGASTYTISGGNSVVTPTANTNYNVVGTSAQGCVGSNTAVSSVTVNSLPTITAVSNNSLLCVGSTASITASGANTYTWNTSANGAVIAVSPTVTTTYTVNGTSAAGCNNLATITQSVSTCTSIKNLASTNPANILVYPNPSTGLFAVDLTSPAKVTITDVVGKLVYSAKLNEGKQTINLTNLPNGIYILKAESNGVDNSVKLIKE